jgi:hypothetical protein
MYNIDFICTYGYYDEEISKYCCPILDESILEKNDDSDEISNCMYQANFLQSFGLFHYDDEAINKETNRLYKLLIENSEFKECMKKAANKYMSEDLYVGFMFLFSYEYFFLTHECICEFFKTKETIMLKKLQNYIDSKIK